MVSGPTVNAATQLKPIATTSTMQATPSAPADDDAAFISYLRQLLNGPDREWKKAKTAGDILDRHLTLIRAIKQLDELNWGRSAGGYQVSSGKLL
jgi:hypothetical protein